MGSAEHAEKPFPSHGGLNLKGVGRHIDAKVQIQLVGHQQLIQIRRVSADQFHRDVGVGLVVLLVDWRKHGGAPQARHAHPQRAAAVFADIGQGASQILLRGEHLPSVKHHLLAFFCKLERRFAHEQRHTVFLLQSLHMAAQRLLAD